MKARPLGFHTLTTVATTAAFLILHPAPSTAAETPLWQRQVNAQAAGIEAASAADLADAETWVRNAPKHRKELLGMLGLDPMPERGELKAVTADVLEHENFTVEKLHFQSSPGLYVTGNLYVPRKREGRLPAVLYVCGHSQMIEGNVRYGNKTGYQHHPAWLAQNGFVALAIDTVQLGEIAGLHHGTHNLNMWWWNSRGYTPAGVETWNGIRALDYLQSRPEVDPDRLGVTGRSGGGAYSWYISAVDERVKASVPVAGITDLRNHLIDGAVDGHCDCMFALNALRWDFNKVAALVAPRALLIANTDKDPIFPLDGVVRVHRDAARVYKALNAFDKIGLLVAEGPHKDFQELQVGAFRWFKRFLAGDSEYPVQPSKKLFAPAQLKVFTQIPADERTSSTHAWFVPVPPADSFPKTDSAWKESAPQWISRIKEASFANWPSTAGFPKAAVRLLEKHREGGGTLASFTVETNPLPGVESGAALFVWGLPAAVESFIRFTSTNDAGTRPLQQPVTVHVVDSTELKAELDRIQTRPAPPGAGLLALYAPRGHTLATGEGIKPEPWSVSQKENSRIRRRYMLTGGTLESWRVFDIARLLDALGGLAAPAPIEVQASGTSAVNTLYASLFCDGNFSYKLLQLPSSHEAAGAPDYFSILRVLDIPQTIELARSRSALTHTAANPQ
jgi:dienelactone hydrolase